MLVLNLHFMHQIESKRVPNTIFFDLVQKESLTLRKNGGLLMVVYYPGESLKVSEHENIQNNIVCYLDIKLFTIYQSEGFMCKT